MAEVSMKSNAQPAINDKNELIGTSIHPNIGAMKPSAPAPNPSFTFPMLPPMDSSISRELAETEAGTTKRTFHRPRPSNISIGSPSMSGPSDTLFCRTPPSTALLEHSPTRCLQIRGSGHRRGGSEFIGGDSSRTGPGLMSTSPTKGDGVLPSPPLSGMRRGHAHRRSGAISNHDLSVILKPNHEPGSFRPGSAPNTPADPCHRLSSPSLDHSASQPTLRSERTFDDAESEKTPVPSPKLFPRTPTHNASKQPSSSAQPRPRVGFSDTLEFIPRPLSTISSETSSSLSTVHPSHSVTGSITSLVSNISSPPSGKRGHSTDQASREHDLEDSRPSTADPSLLSPPLDLPFDHNDPLHDNSLYGRPSSAHAGLALRIGQASARKAKHSSIQNIPDSPQFHADDECLNGPSELYLSTSAYDGELSLDPGSSKKQKKVKSWAGSLLSRKPRSKSKEILKEKEMEFVPVKEFVPIDNFSLDNVNFDEDTTYVVRDPDYKPPSSARNANNSNWISPDPYNTQAPTVILDLDATWRALDDHGYTENTGGSKRRAMHSSSNPSVFTGPGINYHRRAESAPALTPVAEISSIRQFGSSAEMADVFEEDEEEGSVPKPRTHLHISRPSEEERDLLGLGVKIIESDREAQSCSKQRLNREVKRDHEFNEESCPLPLLEKEADETVPHSLDAVIDIPVEIVDAVDEPRFSVVTKSSDESTVTPTFQESLTDAVPTTLPSALDFASSRMSHLDTPTTASSVPSPDASHVLFDAPRLHTAASSITDRSTWSSTRATESTHAQSCSTEDVPSLTSSASTMISGHPLQLSPAFPPPALLSSDRSYSFSAAVPRRTRPVSAGKRSSLASLTRLVSSSHGEKSKLSIESFAAEGSEKSEKRRHRISRLMKFWKSKDKLDPSNGN